MEKFKILTTIPVSGKDLYLLNQPFQLARKNDTFHKDLFNFTVSSYHEPLEREPYWLMYESLPKGEIVIVSSKESFELDEALLFTVKHNGFGLSRDNLFMMWQLFPEQLKKIVPIEIGAYMDTTILPNHNDGPKICPCLDLQLETDKHWKVHYDWRFVERENEKQLRPFAFFKPFLQRKSL